MSAPNGEPCPACNGTGVIPGPKRCLDDCTPLRHVPGCPAPGAPSKCPFCFVDELGDDLQWSAS